MRRKMAMYGPQACFFTTSYGVVAPDTKNSVERDTGRFRGV
ncbi:hypothetical protein [Proteus mirabilis]